MVEIKKIKGFSSAYPNMCDLKLLPSMYGKWITIQDDVGNSMTIKLTDLSDFICLKGVDKAESDVKPQEPKTGHCKNCKYFEYDSLAKVDGVTLIVAHEICKKWGGGCKTSEDGYCFMFEPQEKAKGSEE